MRNLIAVLTFMLLIIPVSKSQTIMFSFTNGSSSSYTIPEIKNITYTGNTMNVNMLSGSTLSWDINTIEYFEYVVGTMNVDSIENNFNSVEIYPNPAIDKTTIAITLIKESDVTVDILDNCGAIVKNLKSGLLEPGKHNIDLTLNELVLASGIYYYKVKIGELLFTEKINLTR
jgi:hypothetical protein